MVQRAWTCPTKAIVTGTLLWLLSMAAAQPLAAQDKSRIEAGESVYNDNCAACHGDGLRTSGQFFDLRRLTPGDRARFDNSVRNGKGQMPPWKGVLSDEQIDRIWAYIRSVVDR
jgi:mono/diheme cytochrome c family protein